MWQHGFGYSDLENRLLVGTGCIMRIASISKSLTMAVLAKLVEQGKINLGKLKFKYLKGSLFVLGKWRVFPMYISRISIKSASLLQ